MSLAIGILVLFLILGIIFKFIIKSLKFIIILVLIFFISSTVFICVINPKLHKPFSFDIIEYLIKVNDDGSVTTTKQVTRTLIKKDRTSETENNKWKR